MMDWTNYTNHTLIDRLNAEIAQNRRLVIENQSMHHNARQAEQFIADKGLWEEYMTLRVVARMEE
jgi:hypothetical protein